MHSKRRLVLAAGVLALAAATLTATSSAGVFGWSAVPVKPLIGSPTAVPAKPQVGKPFTVAFKVTASNTHAPMTAGLMTSSVSAGGAAIARAQSFKGGIARVSIVVPAAAAGALLRVTVTIKSSGRSATKTVTFAVGPAPKPSVSISGASAAEGNAGTSQLSFAVKLSGASKQTVSVSYATADGTATAAADYKQASGTLTFAPGETSKAIVVSVVGDNAIEPDETLTVNLSSPVNATIATGSATGTITNDDTQVPITNGDWKGSMQTGDFLFFTVTAGRQLSFFRINDVRENCSPGGYIEGSLAWSPNTLWPISADGSISAQNTWTGSDVHGAVEYTSQYWKVTATFNGSTASGTMILSDELNYQGVHFACSTGTLNWTATKQ